MIPAEKITDATAHMPDMHLPGETGESTYFIARLLMDCSEWFVGLFGLDSHSDLYTWVYAILVFLISIAVGTVARWIIQYIVKRVAKVFTSDIYNQLISNDFFGKLCQIIPALVFLIFIQFTLVTKLVLATWLTRLTWIYVTFTVARALDALVMSLWEHLNGRENKRKLPLKGIIQLVELVIWIIAVIVMLAVLFNKSPGSLLAGLGAFAAVLMLIFKDSILGVVAGVQLAENDSLHVGDWISVPGTDANGTVVEVSLTAVKIQNWDKTTSTVPPYNLISVGFKNYRSMQESLTRRICRSYFIDADSVVRLDDRLIEEFRQIPFMKDWIDKKIEQKNAGKVEDVNNSAGLVDGTIETNLGVFRAYLKMYLDANPNISHPDTCFISTLPQTSTGIPLQVYCFTSTSSWLPYEAIQDTVFEHIAVMLYRFHLYTFENPSGRDTLVDGYLSPGKNPDNMFGIPYPFFMNSGTPFNPGTPPAGLYGQSPAPSTTPEPPTPQSPSATTDTSAKA